MASRPAGLCRKRGLETYSAEIKFIDEHIDHPNRSIVRDVVSQALA